MLKKILLLLFVISFITISKSEDNVEIPFNRELTLAIKSIYGNLQGGTNVMINSKSYKKEELELYFKLYKSFRQSFDETNKTRKEFEQMFDRNYLEKYYTNHYLELKNGDKFLYGRFSKIEKTFYYKLELYFIDKNNELKTKIYFKLFENGEGYNYVNQINKIEKEMYFYVPYIREEITLITENKKVQLSRPFIPPTMNELYEKLLKLFKDEIPKEFFEQRDRESEDEYFSNEPDYVVPPDYVIPTKK